MRLVAREKERISKWQQVTLVMAPSSAMGPSEDNLAIFYKKKKKRSYGHG